MTFNWPEKISHGARSMFETLKSYKPIPTQRHLLTPLGNKPFENTVGKGEIAHNEQFLLFPQCFLPVWVTFCQFQQFEIVVCKLFQFRRI